MAVAGVLSAASLFTHPVGGFFSFCVLGVLGFNLDRRRFRWGHALLFGLPFVVLGGLWGIYAAQDFAAFRTQLAGNAAGRWDGILHLYRSIYGELRFKYFQAYGFNTYHSFSLQHLRLIALFTYLASLVAVVASPFAPESRRRADAARACRGRDGGRVRF